MAVGIVNTDVEGALPSVPGLVVPVETEVQTMVGRQGVVVRRTIDFIFHTLFIIPDVGAFACEAVA